MYLPRSSRFTPIAPWCGRGISRSDFIIKVEQDIIVFLDNWIEIPRFYRNKVTLMNILRSSVLLCVRTYVWRVILYDTYILVAIQFSHCISQGSVVVMRFRDILFLRTFSDKQVKWIFVLRNQLERIRFRQRIHNEIERHARAEWASWRSLRNKSYAKAIHSLITRTVFVWIFSNRSWASQTHRRNNFRVLIGMDN